MKKFISILLLVLFALNSNVAFAKTKKSSSKKTHSTRLLNDFYDCQGYFGDRTKENGRYIDFADFELKIVNGQIIVKNIEFYRLMSEENLIATYDNGILTISDSYFKIVLRHVGKGMFNGTLYYENDNRGTFKFKRYQTRYPFGLAD